MDYAIDLKNFYEPMDNKPLLQNAIVESANGRTYRADRWFRKGLHCYVFIDITMHDTPKPPFAQSPSQVTKAIKNNKIIVKKYGFESAFN